MPATPNRFFIILILGALSTVSPISIDMYLPAFPQIARDLGTTPSEISFSVSGYFIGLALGQLIYGPLLDRFGRKLPIYAGLSLFIVSSIACMTVHSPNLFIAFRLLQALGGCVAQVGAITMVRDFFPVEESAKIISLLVLVLSVSPLFAPTIGGLVSTTIGWPWIFAILAAFAVIVMAVIYLFLPEGHKPDPTISLRPSAIFGEFLKIIGLPQFYTYALGGAFAFAGLFVYVTGSPIIFLDGFHLAPRTYGLVFAGLAISFIGGSQLNVLLSRRFLDRQIYRTALYCQCFVGAIILVGTLAGWYGLTANIVLLLLYLPFCGMGFPNAAAIALAPFGRNVGSASALLGFLQMGIGAFASTSVGFLRSADSAPIFAAMTSTAFIGLVIVLANRHRPLVRKPEADEATVQAPETGALL
ncbi:MAG TPA: multidrug effflux MFS transporter [Xanthobacteraceae bacterium]|nr:multidrug effflux MFS transporter [Xanthobacteraceae bacterium]